MGGTGVRGELSGIAGMLSRGERDAAAACVARLRDSPDAQPLLRACEIMLECDAGRTDRAEILLGRSGELLSAATMRDVNEFFVRLFLFHLDRAEMGCARRILDAAADYGLCWRDFGMAYLLYCDRASLAEEGLRALEAYYPGIGQSAPEVLSLLRSRYPFLTGLPAFRGGDGP